VNTFYQSFFLPAALYGVMCVITALMMWACHQIYGWVKVQYQEHLKTPCYRLLYQLQDLLLQQISNSNRPHLHEMPVLSEYKSFTRAILQLHQQQQISGQSIMQPLRQLRDLLRWDLLLEEEVRSVLRQSLGKWCWIQGVLGMIMFSYGWLAQLYSWPMVILIQGWMCSGGILLIGMAIYLKQRRMRPFLQAIDLILGLQLHTSLERALDAHWWQRCQELIPDHLKDVKASRATIFESSLASFWSLWPKAILQLLSYRQQFGLSIAQELLLLLQELTDQWRLEQVQFKRTLETLLMAMTGLFLILGFVLYLGSIIWQMMETHLSKF
jgi:hypothetical protein